MATGRKVGSKSFAKVVGKNFDVVIHNGGIKEERVKFTTKAEDAERFKREFMGFVVIPGSSYNIQTYFEVGRYFLIKVTPLGAYICLLEETED